MVKADLVDLKGDRVKRAPSRVLTRSLTPNAIKILDNIPSDGTSMGGATLRSAVNLGNELYSTALHELQDKDAIRVGPGRGGSIRRSSSVEPSSVPAQAPARERDLYQPFMDWLESSWPTTRGDSLQEAMITATPRGYKKNSGTWTRPDITALRVDRYELLPGAQRIQLELSSYEIKPTGETRVEWVFEAAAQARWAHRSTLVLEASHMEWKADIRIVSEIRRFNLGLYYMTRVEGSRYDIRVTLEPGLQTPEPGDLQDAIERFITLSDKPDLPRRYRSVIG